MPEIIRSHHMESVASRPHRRRLPAVVEENVLANEQHPRL